MSAKTLAFIFIAWGLPVAIALYVFWVALAPSWNQILHFELPPDSSGLDLGPGWQFLVVWAILTLSLGLNAKYVFRCYEGYWFPPRLKDHLSRTHWLRRELARLDERLKVSAEREALATVTRAGTPTVSEVRAELAETQSQFSKHVGALGTLTERVPGRYRINWRDYPRTESQAMPTLFGNRIRQFERYGNDRFGLDVLVLWYEFASSADQRARDELEGSRQSVEISLASSLLSLALSVAALLPLAWRSTWGSSPWTLVATGIIALILSRLTYRQAVAQTSDWGSAVMSLVNMNRAAVAAAFGFVLPSDFESERKFWGQVTGFVRTGSAAYAESLDAFPRVERKNE